MLNELIEKIGSLTLMQAAELVKMMEDKFGISTTPVAVAGSAPAKDEPAIAEEKTEFTIFFESFNGEKKVDAIKKVREITGLPLMDAKKLVESGNQKLKENVNKEDAEKIKSDLESIGAKITLK